MTTLAIRLR